MWLESSRREPPWTSPDTPFSAGKDDISVAQLSTAEGDVKWLKQIGLFYGNDGIARCGGVVPDAADKAVTFGDTTGQFYRDRSEDSHPHYSDTFVLILDQKDRRERRSTRTCPPFLLERDILRAGEI
jgi:hypothetical protein